MRLIDADKALKIAESYGTTHGTTLGRHSGVADIIHYEIAKLPTIEAEPVRHGKWVKHGGDKYPYYECSECGHDNNMKNPYCAYCGAKMDGGCENEIHR